MDVSTLLGGPAAKEPAPVEPIYVSGMAYARIIDGMMNIGFYVERATSDGGSERVIVAKLVFSAAASTVARAIAVNQAMLDGAMRDQAEQQGKVPRRPESERAPA